MLIIQGCLRACSAVIRCSGLTLSRCDMKSLAWLEIELHGCMENRDRDIILEWYYLVFKILQILKQHDFYTMSVQLFTHFFLILSVLV